MKPIFYISLMSTMLINCAPDYSIDDLFLNHPIEKISDTSDECEDDWNNGAGGSSESSSSSGLGCQVPEQIIGDCKEKICSESGEVIEINDDSDVDSNNPCNFSYCENGQIHYQVNLGMSCEMDNGFYGWCNAHAQCTQYLTCRPNFFNCDGDINNGCETQNNDFNCGGCGIVCTAPNSWCLGPTPHCGNFNQ